MKLTVSISNNEYGVYNKYYLFNCVYEKWFFVEHLLK